MQSIESISEADLAQGRISFGEKLIQLHTLGNILSESLEQIGPITGFLRIYSSTKSAFLVTAISQYNVAAKDQEVRMGYSRDVYQRGSSLLIPYAKYLVKMLQVFDINLGRIFSGVRGHPKSPRKRYFCEYYHCYCRWFY
jgi:hypothetical protein